ncbi:MAG: hypothetical protein ABJA84_00010 [Polaromonas sp.]
MRTIIIPADLVGKARNFGETLSPAGANMYLTPLSPTGNLPATHYISSGIIGSEFADLLPLITVSKGAKLGDPDIVTKAPGKPVVMHAAATAGAKAQKLTLTATEPDAVNIMDQSDTSGQPPFEAMARLGLQMLKGTL